MTIIIIIVLILLSGLFSGLTLGLYSLDFTELERKTELGNKRAERVFKVRQRGNLLLVSLLLGNVAVNAAISIILADVSSGVVAGVVATGLIVIFGEIIPQATCARYALEVGSRTAWMVELLMFILYPVGKPIAWLLDKILGRELRTVWTKKELRHIIQMHEDDPRSSVDRDEERILLGALEFSEKTAVEIMKSYRYVYSIQKSAILDHKRLHEIRESGYTRIPVYSKNKKNIVGMLYTKDLIDVQVGSKVTKMMRTADLVRVSRKRKLDGLLNDMIKHREHMAFVNDKKGNFLGIVTLEDIMEEIIGREIRDEDDEEFDRE